ncbi:phosphomevalonate kinase [Streptomyces sp. NPDC058067]|uniref:phosphomevalonate kinase n=1 Tax=Streptomyces sp. NPDC058067 TaxID=3346324 RepID=UPI0036EC2234
MPVTGPRTVTRRAPGKLFVAGEYAVVEPGNQAILVAVDRYITVTVSDGASPGVVVSSDVGAGPVHHPWRDGRLTGAAGSPHVVAAVETVARLLAERGGSVPPWAVSISSTLHEDGRKFGLGSSGAVTVATVTAVAAHCGLELTVEERFRLALLAAARIDPKGSGGDIATSTWGGWIAYRAPDRDAVLDLARRKGVDEALRAQWPGLSVRRLPPPRNLRLEVGWTGNPVSTTSLVTDLQRRTWWGSSAHRTFVGATGELVHAAVTALEDGDAEGLLRQVRRAREELVRLDDEVRLGIFTPELTALCAIAEHAGGAAKPSGAGGGDCGIALLHAEALHDRSQLRRRWAAAGVLPLPVSPAMEGVEE